MLVFLLSLGGCRAAHDPAARPSAAEDPVLAEVGDAVVRLSDLQSLLHEVPEEQRSTGTTAEVRRILLQRLIVQKVMVLEARKAGLDRDEDFLRRFEHAKEGLLVEEYMHWLERQVKVPDEEVERYSLEHPHDIPGAIEIQASRIVVNSLEGAREVQRLLKVQPFAEVARRYSIESETAKDGGLLPPFYVGQFDPQFEKIVLPLRVGEISGIQKTALGYQLARKEDQIAHSPVPTTPEEVKESVRSKLRHAEILALMQSLPSKVPVRIHEDVLASLDSTPLAAPSPAARN